MDLIELLIHHPDMIDLATTYIEAMHIQDSDCRRIVQLLFEHRDVTLNELINRLTDHDECRRIIAQVTAAPKFQKTKEATPEQIAQHLILVIRKKTLEQQRQQLTLKREKAAPKEQAKLSASCAQLTLDIKTLQQGWERAQPILECLD
jgi:hypothetical protein